ncbi:Prefoldin alpha-like protein [Mycena vitilis]|nr:Prefoldin alpha-like protein [Mycena vitilis]
MSQQQIKLTDLDLPQLAEVRRELDEELDHLTSSFGQLKQAQTKFRACIENVAEIKPANNSEPILVPLTSSLYIPGKLSDPDHVIVDVGTGYSVQKTRQQAGKHYSAKVDYIQENLVSLEEAIGAKRENMNYLVNVMESKLQRQTA